MKQYEIISDRWAAVEGELTSDLAPGQPIRMIVLEIQGALASAPNQPNASIKIALSSTQAEAMSKVLAGLAKTIPSIPDQVKDFQPKENNA